VLLKPKTQSNRKLHPQNPMNRCSFSCIAGYRDRKFRGNQATSRYEFAAGLNACLDKINEIISAGLADKVSKEDLATLQKLLDEFATELATLRGSTTTKLFGQAVFGLQTRLNNSADINVRNGVRDTADPATNLTYGASVQLSLLTQFPDRSILLTGLQAGNISTSNSKFKKVARNTKQIKAKIRMN
jgi:hypothetical protein